MLQSAVTAACAGEVYICGNSETWTLKDIVREIYASPGNLKRHRRSAQRMVPLPLKVSQRLAGAIDSTMRRLALASGSPDKRLGFFEDNHWFDTSKLERDISIRFEHSNATALQTTTDWYIEQGKI